MNCQRNFSKYRPTHPSHLQPVSNWWDSPFNPNYAGRGQRPCRLWHQIPKTILYWFKKKTFPAEMSSKSVCTHTGRQKYWLLFWRIYILSLNNKKTGKHSIFKLYIHFKVGVKSVPLLRWAAESQYWSPEYRMPRTRSHSAAPAPGQTHSTGTGWETQRKF